ncbi:MAG: C4-dicarboxylate transporter DctQ subunit [Granulosicoccus sp.]|jgi:C4-dicarboxylate transporter DctQ subunit
MTSAGSNNPSTGDRIEETLIAFFLGAMTLITFANVIARLMHSNILWALEATVFLFAFLVLMGASYAVKHTFHIGVDVLVVLLPKPKRRLVALFAVTVCIVFSLLLFKGSWDYWWAFVTKRAFYEVNDIPMPAFLQFFAHWLNDGELYEKMPRFIPYTIMPVSTALLTYRFVQAGMRVWRGEQDLLVESHEEVDEKAEVETEAGAN